MNIPYPLFDASYINVGLAQASVYKVKPKRVNLVSAFVPQKSYISLGASNKLETNVNVTECLSDGIEVFKRLSGGEAVFLSPNCVVFSRVLVDDLLPKSGDAFNSNLELITNVLSALGVKRIERQGISDLTIGNRKILGCSIYRKPNYLLFHAVLNVCEDPEIIARYLQHPVREPDYRKSRLHTSFITSLHGESYYLSPDLVAEALLNWKAQSRE
ncbi:hypothetical protein MASR2M64_09710 [Candidatus Cloacimonadota bacterium]